MTTMTTNPHANGRSKRSSLNEQIDRLDTMLDGLSEGLNEAVADAVKAAVGGAVKEAVQTVLKEVLASAIVAKLQSSSPSQAGTPPSGASKPPSGPNFGQRLGPAWQRARGWAARLRGACRNSVQNLRVSATGFVQWAAGPLKALWVYRDLLGVLKYQLSIAIVVGVLVALLAYHVRPSLAALIGGIGGFVTALAVQGVFWLRKLLKIQGEEMA